MKHIQSKLVRGKRDVDEESVEAELVGSRLCIAGSVRATGNAPALALCRQLLAQGIDPDSALHVYRAGVLALRVRSIREGASLTVEDDEYGTPRLRKIREQSRGAAPPIRNSSDTYPTRPANAPVDVQAREKGFGTVTAELAGIGSGEVA
jgi:hypothetical protein